MSGVMKKLGEITTLNEDYKLDVYKCASGTTTIRQGGKDLFLRDTSILELIDLLQIAAETTVIKEKK
jgi:hypothetical protein